MEDGVPASAGGGLVTPQVGASRRGHLRLSATLGCKAHFRGCDYASMFVNWVVGTWGQDYSAVAIADRLGSTHAHVAIFPF